MDEIRSLHKISQKIIFLPKFHNSSLRLARLNYQCKIKGLLQNSRTKRVFEHNQHSVED